MEVLKTDADSRRIQISYDESIAAKRGDYPNTTLGLIHAAA